MDSARECPKTRVEHYVVPILIDSLWKHRFNTAMEHTVLRRQKVRQRCERAREMISWDSQLVELIRNIHLD